MNLKEKIHLWAARRFKSVQYPSITVLPPRWAPRRFGFFEKVPEGMLPPSLPQTRFGLRLAQFVVFGWFVVLCCIAAPVLYACGFVLLTIFGFIH